MKVDLVTTCDHGQGEFSLSISVEDTMVGLTTFAYDHRAGNLTRVDFFHMSTDQMYEMAEKIMEAANNVAHKQAIGTASIKDKKE
jgi:hypothetical protein